ncbi:amidohydrolase [Arthrobacter sp. CAU 1506]|uniref:amidohydrolase n=1 Tax=Arthrobacter sp. CAU 1506 TaxID=2560052 RepID=UPI0010ACD56D|nr:amidohydrolase [Arthrobacter sp. CAU 1506]TJY66236.1 amidohydrolase [Arthrobacter sp. CAU 1506]
MTAPSLVITGAQLWTPARSSATALAVANGRIAAIGSDGEILTLAGPETVRIEAGGAAVLPGFHDGHIHAQAGGLALLGCDLERAHSLEGYSALIHDYAVQHHDEWLVGSGWFGDVFPGGLPTRQLLDEIVPDRPAVLTSHDAHGVWVNTKALERAGITRETPDPAAGRIIRDELGEPTGVLMDAAGELVTRLIPPNRPEELCRALLEAQQHLFSLGITAWHDAILGAYLTLPDSLPAYIETLADGSLRARVTGSMWWPPAAGPDYIPELLERIRAAGEAGFEVRSVKIMQDGICENCTAALIEPYTGVHPAVRGDSVISPEHLGEIVAQLDAAGLSIHFHGVGDRAVRECLDAVAHARQRNGSGQRHQIAHLDVVDPADFGRFAELKVTANLQPLWARNDQEILERKFPLIGEDRARYHFPFESLRQAGAHLAMGSDWPVTSPDPLWGLYTASTRTAPIDDVHALNAESRVPAQPQERLGIDDSIYAYTLGSAEASGIADRIGSLESGKLADLVILTGPIEGAESFDQVRVGRTILGGDTVYESTPSS